MDMSDANSRIQKLCTIAKEARKKLGQECATILDERLRQMEKAETLEDLRFVPGDWHELMGDRQGQLSCKLYKSKRLVFTPDDPRPIKPDGGLDWSKVTAVVNLEIVDYH
jgi:proteic killer suppression protein